MKAFVLVECDFDKRAKVTKYVKELTFETDNEVAVVTECETVEGPFDVIATVEGDSIDVLYKLIAQGIQRVAGVTRTETGLVYSFPSR